MPIEKTTEQDIIDAVESELRTEFGNDIDLTKSSTFSSLAKVLAAVLSENQEQSLQDVYDSGFLDTAEGSDLDKVVAIIGIKRRPAIHSTGVQRFISDTPVTGDKTIKSGTVVQTNSSNPAEYETIGSSILQYIDGWENNDLSQYSGDTGTTTFSTVSTHPKEGSYELKAGATAGDHIYNDNVELGEGTEMHFDVYPEADTTPIITFGVQDASNYYQAVIDCSPVDGSEELRIEKVENGSVTQTIGTTTGLNIPEGQYLHAELDWNITGQISLDVDDVDGNDVATAGGEDTDSTRWREGYVGFKSGDATASKYWDEATTAAVSSTIRAKVGGVHANVGANSVVSLPSPPSGVDETKNLYPVGDNTYDDTAGEPFVIGNNREEDEELRERAESVFGGGAATHDAIVNELKNNVENVTSVTGYENKSDTDNTGTGGLPPHAFEVVAYGGDDLEIAEAIHSKKAYTANDYGGANGTGVTKTVTAPSNGQKFDIQFTRPASVNIDFTMDIVVSDTYIGDTELEDRIVEFVGGTKNDGTKTIGLDVGEDVTMDEVEDIVTGQYETGVIGFDMNASTTEITTTPSKTTNSNGLEVVSIGGNEVAQTDATDASITINTTEI